MPADLAARFERASITVLKGDLNYRRLVGDRDWPPLTPFADAAPLTKGTDAGVGRERLQARLAAMSGAPGCAGTAIVRSSGVAWLKRS
jgi:hypothetical protein